MSSIFLELDQEDYLLIAAAQDTLKKTYHAVKHTVAAAVLCSSGKIYTGINVESVFGPCAESVAIGSAFTNGEQTINSIVSVHKKNDDYPVLSPCGNCRQLLVLYAPEAMVILNNDNRIVKASARDLLPGAYTFNLDKKSNSK